MSLYSAGLGALPFTPDGALSESPSQLKDEATTLDREYKILWGDVEKSKLDQPKKDAIRSLVTEWNHFFKEHTGFASRVIWAKGTLRRLIDFRKRLERTRNILSKMSKKVQLTPPNPHGAMTTLPRVEDGFPWRKILLYGGLGIAGVAGGLFVYRRFRKPANAAEEQKKEVRFVAAT